MKKSLILGLISFSSFSWAHGTAVEQAAAAVHSAAELFETLQPRETIRLLSSVTATKSGHEQFEVVIALNDGRQFAFACMENESVEPAVWECAAR